MQAYVTLQWIAKVLSYLFSVFCVKPSVKQSLSQAFSYIWVTHCPSVSSLLFSQPSPNTATARAFSFPPTSIPLPITPCVSLPWIDIAFCPVSPFLWVILSMSPSSRNIHHFLQFHLPSHSAFSIIHSASGKVSVDIPSNRLHSISSNQAHSIFSLPDWALLCISLYCVVIGHNRSNSHSKDREAGQKNLNRRYIKNSSKINNSTYKRN